MDVTLTLDGPLDLWAKNQSNVVEAIKEILLARIAYDQTPFDLAIERMRTNIAKLPETVEFEIPQVIGVEHWSALDRASRLALGKHVRASADAYGITFLRKSSSNHAIYRRK